MCKTMCLLGKFNGTSEKHRPWPWSQPSLATDTAEISVCLHSMICQKILNLVTRGDEQRHKSH